MTGGSTVGHPQCQLGFLFGNKSAYFRVTMEEHLNNLKSSMILHIHSTDTDNLNVDKVTSDVIPQALGVWLLSRKQRKTRPTRQAGKREMIAWRGVSVYPSQKMCTL